MSKIVSLRYDYCYYTEVDSLRHTTHDPNKAQKSNTKVARSLLRAAPVVESRWWIDASGYSRPRIDYAVTNEKLVVRRQPSKGRDGSALFPLSFDTVPYFNDQSGRILWWRDVHAAPVGQGSDWMVACGSVAGGRGKIQVFDPFNEALMADESLHVQFANLQDDDEIFEFADRYGFLGGHTVMLQPMDGSAAWVPAEPLSYWRYEVKRVRYLLGLASDLLNGDEFTGALIDVQRGGWVGVKSVHQGDWVPEHGDRLPVAVDGAGDDAFSWGKEWKPSSATVRAAGESLLRHLLGVTLQEHTFPWFEIPSRHPVQFVPTTLLGSIYLLLMARVTGEGKPVMYCEGCGKAFYQADKKRKHCSDACKFRVYRARRKAING